MRPDHAVFVLPVLVSMCPSQTDDEATERNTLSIRAACWFKKQISSGDAHVFVECASDSLIPNFLRVTLDTFWRARFGATSNTFADLSKCFCLHVFSGGV